MLTQRRHSNAHVAVLPDARPFAAMLFLLSAATGLAAVHIQGAPAHLADLSWIGGTIALVVALAASRFH